MAVARYHPDGSPDLSFGHDGTTLVHLSSHDIANAVAVQPDGKILLAGSRCCDSTTGSSRLAMVRLNPNGERDLTFGSAGEVSVGPMTSVAAIRLQPHDGKILVAGHHWTGPAQTAVPPSIVVARFNQNGAPDPGFGDLGFARFAVGEASGASDVDLQADGKIVAVGYTGRIGTTVRAIGLVRLLPNGQPDMSFGTNGSVITNVGQVASAKGVVLSDTGQIIVAGTSDQRFVIARYHADGRADASFGTSGQTLTSIGTAAEGNDVVIDRAGRLVVAGGTDDGTAWRFATARYLP